MRVYCTGTIMTSFEGIKSTHVDDFCWEGTSDFVKNVINRLRKVFQIGKENSIAFTYLGLNLKQKVKEIQIDQVSYLQSIQPVFISKSRSCRKQVGQLNWLGTQTRPDILFECCTLMSSIKDAKVSDQLRANKLLSRMKSDQVSIKLFDIVNTDKMKLIAYHDASYANLQDGNLKVVL